MKNLKIPFELLNFKAPHPDIFSDDIFNDVYYNGQPFTGIAFEKANDHYTEYSYKNGFGHGICISTYNNGQKMAQFELQKGKYIGESHEWYKDGKLKWRKVYGENHEKEYWNNNGQKLYHLLAQKDLEKVWYATGQLKWERKGKIKRYYALNGKELFYINYDERVSYYWNEKNMYQCYADLLEEHDNDGIFVWVRQKINQDNPIGKKVLLALLSHNNLNVKSAAIKLCGQEKIHEFANTLKSFLSDSRKAPFLYDPLKVGVGKGPTKSISELSKGVLEAMGLY